MSEIQPAKQVAVPMQRRESTTSQHTTLTAAVAAAQAQQQAQAQPAQTLSVDTNQPISEQQELQNLRQIIVTWRELESEVSELNSQIREKRKRMKALEEMILRIMKKYTIGALDLKGSGGRILYRRQTAKGSLNQKTLVEMLTAHLKSETAANDAIKYINEHRGAKVRESLLYEKE
jgi:predicted RNase H-like nuclease (RuvC/YqgF family)